MISIDTLRLRFDLNQVKIDDGTPIKVKPAEIDLASGEVKSEYALFQYTSGKIQKGSEAYYLKTPKDLFALDFRSSGIYLKFTLPRLVYKTHNAFPITKEEAESALDELEKHLNSIGIHLTIRSAFLSRVDIFRNLTMNRSPKDYKYLLEQLDCKRMKPKDLGVTSYRFENTRCQLEFYDKYLQVKKKYKLDLDNLSKKTLRVEYRMRKGDKCRDILKVKTLDGLLNNWTKLSSIYKSQIKDLIFYFDDMEARLAPDSFFEGKRIEWMKNNIGEGTYLFNYYLKDLAYRDLNSICEDDEDLVNILNLFGGTKSTRSKRKREIRRSRDEVPSPLGYSVPLYGLFEELKSKIMAD